MRIEIHQVCKRFGSNLALEEASLVLEPGEIHALLGENGAGKTTLMNILYGLLQPDGGEIRMDGASYHPRSPQEAQQAGLGMVHQHFMLVPTLTVLENIILGEKPFSFFPRRQLLQQVAAKANEMGFVFPLETEIRQLSVGELQRVEIFKALWRGAQVLILDEPTAVLAPQEVGELILLLKKLREKGHTILFISHKLDEIRSLCDRVTVLRRGKTIASTSLDAISNQELSRQMLGYDLPPIQRNKTDQESGVGEQFVIHCSGKKPKGKLKGPWEVRVPCGQITAIAGIEGNGQRELAESILGLRSGEQVSVRLGEKLLPEGIHERIAAGVGFISEDRQRTGLVLEMTLTENFALKDIEKAPWSSHGWFNVRAAREKAESLVECFSIIPPEVDQPVRNLSGGNQQKVVAGREITRQHRLLVATNPTRGLDVGACRTVHQALLADIRAGAAVLLISTELDEILTLADHLYVIHQGRLTRLEREDWNPEKIGLVMMGRDRES